MNPNPYASANVDDAITKKRGVFRWLALAVSFLVCVVPTGVAVYAWLTHWHWKRTGAYARNSFPMNEFAKDATWVAVACLAIIGCCWGLGAFVKESVPRSEPAPDEPFENDAD